MSRYEWERGEIRTAFKRELQSTFTALMDRQYELARALYEHLRKAGKGKRKFDYLREAQEWTYAQRPRLGEYDAESASAVIDAVLKVDEHGRSRLRSPKKKDFRVRRNVLDFWHRS